jgi:hypothetical protein
MPSSATFKVSAVMKVPGRSATYIIGEINEGNIEPGMIAKVMIEYGVYLVAAISSIGHVREAGATGRIALALETPRAELFNAWKSFCRPGYLLEIDVAKKD